MCRHTLTGRRYGGSPAAPSRGSVTASVRATDDIHFNVSLEAACTLGADGSALALVFDWSRLDLILAIAEAAAATTSVARVAELVCKSELLVELA